MHSFDDVVVGVIGLGYVGLPLAVAFGQRMPTVGFDINARRVESLRKQHDGNGEVTAEEFAAASLLTLTDAGADLAGCNVYVVTVPTPVDEAMRPDLGPLESASRLVGSVLKKGDIVVFESTVYPGTTEEVCVPILEAASGLVFNRDFFCGYSPERINPGDKARRLTDIRKVTSGSTPEAAARVDALYRTIIKAGTHLAPSIRVAEAAKVIENTQRDVNIALINELSMIFDAMSIDTLQVLEAAETKWNFLPFRPGLVGGHCIGVDPYYLTHKATVLGYHPELILAARRINSRMGIHVAHQLLRLMAGKRINVIDARILVLGFTFKEDCPDLRNTRVVDIVTELQAANAHIDIVDAHACPNEAKHEYGITLLREPANEPYDAVVIAVPHTEYRDRGAEWIASLAKPRNVVYDVKAMLPHDKVDARL